MTDHSNPASSSAVAIRGISSTQQTGIVPAWIMVEHGSVRLPAHRSLRIVGRTKRADTRIAAALLSSGS
ncbi:MAG: hypothetical protein R3E87_11255 [Burkholderiaceae bacterium]